MCCTCTRCGRRDTFRARGRGVGGGLGMSRAKVTPVNLRDLRLSCRFHLAMLVHNGMVSYPAQNIPPLIIIILPVACGVTLGTEKKGPPPLPNHSLGRREHRHQKPLCSILRARNHYARWVKSAASLVFSQLARSCGREAINSFFMRNHRERVVTAAAYVALDTGDRESRAESHATLVKTALPCRGRNTWGLEFDRPGNACVRCAEVLVKMA